MGSSSTLSSTAITLCFILIIFISIGNSSLNSICKLKFKSIESQESYNKHIILNFFKELKNPQKFPQVILKYMIKDGYIQHDPNVADGRDAVIESGFKYLGNSTRNPIEFIRNIGADEDLVWVHCKEISPINDEYAIVRIFRLECGLIAEHWDVIQQIKPNSTYANSHPFF